MSDEVEARRARIERAVRLRRSGASYADIARVTGFRSAYGAQRAVERALREVYSRENAEAVLSLELARLDELQMPMYRLALQGDTNAADRVLKIMERRSKLLGLDDFEKRIADAVEAQTALVEADALLIVTVIDRILNSVDLTPAQRELVEVAVPRELAAIADVVAAEVVDAEIVEDDDFVLPAPDEETA